MDMIERLDDAPAWVAFGFAVLGLLVLAMPVFVALTAIWTHLTYRELRRMNAHYEAALARRRSGKSGNGGSQQP